MSEKSTPCAGAGPAGGVTNGASVLSPFTCATVEVRVATGMTSIPSTAAASAALTEGAMISSKPPSRAASARQRAPRTGRTSPFNPSSPTKRRLAAVGEARPQIWSIARATGRSSEAPTFRKPAGRGLRVPRAPGGGKPAVAKRRANALARLPDARVRQADDGEAGEPRGNVDLHVQDTGVDSHDGGGMNSGKHRVLLGARRRQPRGMRTSGA